MSISVSNNSWISVLLNKNNSKINSNYKISSTPPHKSLHVDHYKQTKKKNRSNQLLRSRFMLSNGTLFKISHHCMQRMHERGLSTEDLKQILDDGIHLYERHRVMKACHRDIAIIYDVDTKLLFTVYHTL